jgi:Domain of unknown function (DUF4258)
MRIRNPGILLVIYILLPKVEPLTPLYLLCQVSGLYAAVRAEKNLYLDLELDKNNIELDENINEAVARFIASLYLNSSNTLACTYIELLAPHLNLFNYNLRKIRRMINRSNFEFSHRAVDQSIMCQIKMSDIEKVIANGQIVREYFTRQHHSGYLISGFTQSQRLIHVKCSHFNRPLINIIAVHEIDSE